jgi:hypothetical protein
MYTACLFCFYRNRLSELLLLHLGCFALFESKRAVLFEIKCSRLKDDINLIETIFLYTVEVENQQKPLSILIWLHAKDQFQEVNSCSVFINNWNPQLKRCKRILNFSICRTICTFLNWMGRLKNNKYITRIFGSLSKIGLKVVSQSLGLFVILFLWIVVRLLKPSLTC